LLGYGVLPAACLPAHPLFWNRSAAKATPSYQHFPVNMISRGSGVSPRYQSHEKNMSRRDAAPTALIMRKFFTATVEKPYGTTGKVTDCA
jgi:hypothetical protein